MSGAVPNAALFTSDRFSVRHWTPADQNFIHSLYRDPEVIRWVGDGTPLSKDGAAQWIGITQANYDRYGYGMNVIERLSDGQMIGCGGIVHPGGQPEPEIKYAFARPHWGLGYATEFVHAIVAHGRCEHGLGQFMATAARDNAASCRVLQKCGFVCSDAITEDDGTVTDVYLLD